MECRGEPDVFPVLFFNRIHNIFRFDFPFNHPSHQAKDTLLPSCFDPPGPYDSHILADKHLDNELSVVVDLVFDFKVS
jgi:hypothetical protein